MDIMWFVAGVALVAIEMVTGTLYLLVLGVAAMAAAFVAYMGAGLLAQVLAFGIVAAFALIAAHARRKSAPQKSAPSLEVGQPVTFENWTDKTTAKARVRYRGTLWDARVSGDCSGNPGEILYITAVDGATLTIARQA